MSFDIGLAIAGLFVGVVVGLTGMGGGALMTPVLVLFFNVPPLTAVSSDLVASFFMKPFGAFVHLRRGTVNLKLVGWLCLGSVPSAFAGVFVLRLLGGNSASLQDGVKKALGIALLIAAAGLIAKAYLTLIERTRATETGEADPERAPITAPNITIRPIPTVAIGAIGGLVVGMTSVGSGSLIIIALIALYPLLQANQLVGTDLVQAVPLVGAAALGHVLYGDFQLGITTSLLVGAIPGTIIGAQLSSRAPGGIIRRALALVLVASALKLLGADNTVTVSLIVFVLLASSFGWMLVRRTHGLPALARTELAEPTAVSPTESQRA